VAMVGRGVLPIRGGLDPPNAARPTDAPSRLKASLWTGTLIFRTSY
jgi:hypothetical protein